MQQKLVFVTCKGLILVSENHSVALAKDMRVKVMLKPRTVSN